MKPSRRSILKGFGLGAGAALFAPLLSRFAQAGESEPCRFVFVVEGNSFEPLTMLAPSARTRLDSSNSQPIASQRWWYKDYRHESVLDIASPDLASARSLGALSAQSLVDRASVVYGLSSRVAGGGHSNFHGCLSSSRTIGGSPGGPTIESQIAEVSGTRPFDAIRLGVGSGASLNFQTVAFDRGKPAPLILSPHVAYDILFGSIAGGNGFAQRQELLDFALADASAARSAFGDGHERQRLDTYLSSIETLRTRQMRLQDVSGQLAQVAPEGPDTNPLYASADALDTLAAQFELGTAALLGELTSVVVIASGTGGDFNLKYNSVSAIDRHNMQHGSGSSASLLDAVHTITQRQVDLVAKMARSLADAPDPAGGNMLDRTLIVYITENGEQHHSTASEFPTLLIGGEEMGVRQGGRTLVYPGLDSSGHRQVSNLWNTVGHIAGQDLNDFGTEGPARMAEGPLGEILR